MLEDKVFGSLKFDVGWVKYIDLNIKGKIYNVKLRVSAYEDEVPNDLQQSAYINFFKNYGDIINKGESALKDYLEKCGLKYADVVDKIIFKEILFIENGVVAIVMDAEWDGNGLVIVINGNEVIAGPQDIAWEYS